MKTIYGDKISEIKREKLYLEEKLGVRIRILGRKIIFEGAPLNEYEAELVLEAINLGFSARTSASVIEGDISFEKINIRDYARSKNLKLVRGRIIGSHGRTKKTIEEVSGCKIALKNNILGIICPAESMSEVITAITNLIRGTKQSNIYRFLEKRNTLKK